MFIRSDVADELAYAARYRPVVYQACVLLGHRSEQGVEVSAYTGLASFDGPFLFLRELIDDWLLVTRRIDRDAPGLEVLGWGSFRPGSEGKLSMAEQIVHRTFFNLPEQVTLSMDPTTDAIAAHGADSSGQLVLIPLDSPSYGHALGAPT